MQRRRRRKSRNRRIVILYLLILGTVIYIGSQRLKPKQKQETNQNIAQTEKKPIENVNTSNTTRNSKRNQIDDWKLTLVNHDNKLPEDYELELANIDNLRKFDSRAISELKEMIEAVRHAGITNIWVQSAYRDESLQEKLFNDKIAEYMREGKTEEEARKLTLQVINEPQTSEHNLGLAVDFNYVNEEFDETKAFEWLQENAEEYGFILRYRKDKEDITKVDYEPWHWRYVGGENAKEINRLDMCLEEYVEYLQK